MLGMNYLKRIGYIKLILNDNKGKPLERYYGLGYYYHTPKGYQMMDLFHTQVSHFQLATFGSQSDHIVFTVNTSNDLIRMDKLILECIEEMQEQADKDELSHCALDKLIS